MRNKETRGGRRFQADGEWDGERERRKRDWSEQERKWRKERRRPTAADLDDALAPSLYRRLLR